MKIFIILIISICYAFSQEITKDNINNTIINNEKIDSKVLNTNEIDRKNDEIQNKINDEYSKIKEPKITSNTLFNKSFFSIFKISEPWYVLPTYYSFSKMYDNRIMQTEIKSQISFRFDILNDIICKFCSFSFDYTQRIYLQTYNDKYSSPLRDFDLSPSISFVYKKPIPIFNGDGGYFNWFSIGYKHTSNGESEYKNMNDPRQAQYNNNFVRSKAFDRLVFETNYRYKDFNARFRTWANMSIIAFDGAKTNGDIGKYSGYGDIKLSYKYKDNLFELYLNNIINNYFTKEYWDWKGHIELGYSYGITKHYAIYIQYLYGYGDSLYEYSLPVNRIGLGLRLRDF